MSSAKLQVARRRWATACGGPRATSSASSTSRRTALANGQLSRRTSSIPLACRRSRTGAHGRARPYT
eukprot:scaffold27486_cov31-Tisochrysis_lutea.AAC.3